jgi:PPK2 family polyphosphate:nucleotide phosphotransferase
MMKIKDYAPAPDSKVRLKDYDPSDDGGLNKESAKAEVKRLQERFEALQEMLYAQGKYALLTIFQAMDTGGKDGVIKKVFSGITPTGLKVASFKAPSAEELSHDFLWRIHRQTPPKGYIGIFNRSHYEDVLIVRVNKLVPKEVWQSRYDHINAFERLLMDSGTHILKFYLNISKQEQKERLQERLDRPDKHWKFSIGDLPVREQWDDYMEAYEDAISRCNTEYAPWYIVPANRKWYRDLVVMRVIVETMEKIGLAYPPAEAGLDKVVIPD